jgi:RING-box protein 1
MSLFTINKVNLITSWSYVLDKNEDCTICRQHLNNNSIYAIEKNQLSTIKQGICGHMFHDECITPWLKSNTKCPICSSKFIN